MYVHLSHFSDSLLFKCYQTTYLVNAAQLTHQNLLGIKIANLNVITSKMKNWKF